MENIELLDENPMEQAATLAPVMPRHEGVKRGKFNL